ncbi:hypothetical protein EIN_247990 [Entamoeba invadens IP1]|uniref:Uncharacterized protein n=1 Tax=Entamoeba invadens IP1 TaxID=370355 RepID=A0A0A1UE20_ENTIV|nr:hypothetical protein EIN_247990 [Entamoeba invadens IP1]ELP94845.1 hypothetical protein EIN_247990 [Entamoeba invadens IP1]|eukprot:XP_004261616.1 hypothetical protein EIN_247990 [Entamoeba invadens IP1]
MRVFLVIAILLTISDSKYLKHCMYLDYACKTLASCEFVEFDVCLSIPLPGDQLEYTYSKTLQTIKGEIETFNFDSLDSCEKGINSTQKVSVNEIGVCFSEESMNVINTISDKLDDEKNNAVAYLSNATFSFGNGENEEHCNKPSTVQVIYGLCTEVERNVYSKASIIGDMLTLQMFKDNNCKEVLTTYIQNRCNSCLAEKTNKDIIRHAKVTCLSPEKHDEL